MAQSSDKAASDALFEQGKKLMTDGAFGQACPKFAESLRLDPGIGTMLRLADCYEKNGQTASAWAQFREAAQVAARANDNREKIAKRRATELEASLPKLSITVAADAQIPGLVIKRDGETIGTATLGIEIPIDPGPHTVTASAPKKKTWTSLIEVPNAAGTRTVAVPMLEDGPVMAGAGPAPTTTPSTNAVPGTEDDKSGDAHPSADAGASKSTWSTQKTLALVAGGVGGLGLVMGAFMGLSASSDLDASNADGHCRADNHCDLQGADLRDSYKNKALASTIGFIIGGVALAGAGVLWFTAPKGPSVAVTPAVGTRDAGLLLRGVW